MFVYGSFVALFLGAGQAVRVSEVTAEVQPAENLADHKAGTEFFPEKDRSILRRIINVAPYAGTDQLLPALTPQDSEKVCGYNFVIEQHGPTQHWWVKGMRVRRHVFDNCEDVELEKRLPIAQLTWTKRSGEKKMFKVIGARSKQELFTIQQERKGYHLFRILPPGTNDPDATLFQFKTSENELYSGSREKEHKWQVYRGNQKEQTEVDVDCVQKLCGFEKHFSDKTTQRIGGTEQYLQEDPDKPVTRDFDVKYLDTYVDVAAGQDAGLVLSVASTIVHKFRVQPTGILASTILG